MDISAESERAVAALSRLAGLWERRLSGGWEPPPGSPFPWAQVRLSLAALLPGMRAAGEWMGSAAEGRPPPPPNNGGSYEGGVAAGEGRFPSGTPIIGGGGGLPSVALLLAGNTPLLAWSPLCACLLAGVGRVHVKMSTAATLWPQLFLESLAEVAPQMAARIELNVWPGEDPRTTDLLRGSDAVIAYGSDATLEALRAQTPAGTPFFGFGHAISVGVALTGCIPEAADFARDVLLYEQAGCLSAQAVFVEEGGGGVVNQVAELLALRLAQETDALQVPPVTDAAAALAVREAREMALFFGDAHVRGDDELRWTLVVRSHRVGMELPAGRGIVQVIPFTFQRKPVGPDLGSMRPFVSSFGVAGRLTSAKERVLRGYGVSRLCRAGEMQTPPLDWPNGGVDLLAELLALRRAGT